MRLVREGTESVKVSQRFGRLTVLGRSFYAQTRLSQSERFMVCECDCGNIRVIPEWYLLAGTTKSCGCLHKTHGASRTRLYGIWCGMRNRCENPNVKSWPVYGARGISVCDEWKEFIVFRGWALANGYADDLTIERIDNDLGYCPSNCTWIPKREQNWNRRNLRHMEAFGESKILSDWMRDSRSVVATATLCRRLRRGMSLEAAMLTPSRTRRFKGRTTKSHLQHVEGR